MVYGNKAEGEAYKRVRDRDVAMKTPTNMNMQPKRALSLVNTEDALIGYINQVGNSKLIYKYEYT